MQPTGKTKTVLLIDDDASHLKLYSLIVATAGFRALTALVTRNDVEIPDHEQIDVTLLDYRLGGTLSSADVASRIQSAYPTCPIVVLSDMMWMPDDMKPYGAAFVRKGEPQQLLSTLAAVIDGQPTA